MKFCKFFRSIILTALLMAAVGAASQTSAQNPCPHVGPCDELPTPTPTASATPVINGQGNSVTLSAFLESLIVNFVAFKTTFISTVEGTLGGYFALLASILAWCVALGYFIQQAAKGEWDISEVGQWTGRLVICLLLLFFCGDVDGDGKRGDIVRVFGFVGYELAFGQSAELPDGNFINKTVEAESKKFNENYDAFVENKLMVRINDRDMPVRYPGMQGVQTVAAVYLGQATPRQQQEIISQEFRIGLLFQLLNLCRSIIGIIDFFLLALYGFSVLVLSIIAPFMFCAFVHKDLAKRFTYPFLWTVFTMLVVFPALSQAARYFAFLSGNVAMGASGNPNYTFDATTYTIISNGDPTPMIAVAVLCMLVSILFLAMSVVLAYALVQGKLVESMNGLIANAFAGISSVGLGAVVTAYGTKMQAEGEKGQIGATYQAQTMQAGYTLEAQKASADAARRANETVAGAGYSSTTVNAAAQRDASQTSALGSLLGGMANVQAEKYQSVNSALSNYRHNMKNMSAEEKKAGADNLIELLQKNDDATSQRIVKELEIAPEKAELLAEQYENILNGIPVGGTVAKTLGLNKDAMNTWMRTEGMKDVGQWIFGDPNTGKGGAMNGLSMPGSLMDGKGKRNQEILGQSPTTRGLVYQQSDGTMVDALTGQRMSSNVTDMTNPNAPKDYGKMPSVGRIYSSGGGNLGGNIPKMSKRQRGNMANMNRLMKSDPAFMKTLQDESIKRGINPNNVLNMLAIESSFDKDVINKDGYLGLGQVGSAERGTLGRYGWTGNNRTDLARVKNMSASQQLQTLVFPFVDQKFKGNTRGLTMDKMYAGWGSGHFSNNPNYVHMEQGGKRNKAYNANPQWDFNKDGKVEQWEFGASAPKNLGAGIYFDANNALGQIRAADPATAKLLSKQFSADAGYKNSMGNNQRVFDGKQASNQAFFDLKRDAENSFMQDQMDIAGGKSVIQQGGLEQVYGSQINSSRITYGGQSSAAEITRRGSLESGQINYGGSMQSANLQFQGQTQSAAVTRDAALDALNKRNMATLVQSVGSGISHQISELFERASRGM